MTRVALITTAVFIAAGTNPGGILGLLFLQTLSILFALALWIAIPLVVLADYAIRLISVAISAVWRSEDPGGPTELGRWSVVPVCTVIWVSVLGLGWPLKARFALGRPAMEQEAKALLAVPSKQADPNDPNVDCVIINRWVGSYYVTSAVVDAAGSRVDLVLDGNCFIWWGFRYDAANRGSPFDSEWAAPFWCGYVANK